MALTQIQQAMLADGILTADAAGRLKMADGFVNTAKLLDGALSADATGRAKMADQFITSPKMGYVGAVLQTQLKRSLTLASSNSTSWIELHNDYRVGITPTRSNSRIILNYRMTVNSNGPDLGTIVHFKAFRNVGGTISEVTGYGGTFNGNIGSRNSVHTALRYCATDSNDVGFIDFTTYDDPGTTAAVEYGFYWKRETGGVSTNYFCHSAGNTSSYGWMAPLVITAQEIAQ